MKKRLNPLLKLLFLEANAIANDDAEACRKIGEFGNTLLGVKDSVLTHCNAGWLAFVDNGSALSPVCAAKAAGKQIIVYSDETKLDCRELI